jgi:cell division protease FtsH
VNDLTKNILVFVVIIVVLLSVVQGLSGVSTGQPVEKPYSEFLNGVRSGQVSLAIVRKDDSMIRYGRSEPLPFYTISPETDNNTLIGLLEENGVEFSGEEKQQQSLIGQLLISSFPILLLIGVWIYFMRQMQGGGGGRGAMSFGKSKARLLGEDQVGITFGDVAGVEEAKVPFFTISGSDFVEMFVGVGASRVRDMFEQAKKQAPCIIFIDELDAVGRHRGAGLGGGHDEREQTLNQMLVEMDGFEGNEGIIVIAATNRPDVLDPALLRPGRFDRQVVVPLPDIRGREAILKVHMRKVPLDEDVKPSLIARGTPGFSGADLANLVNEAALFAARENKRVVSMSEFEKAKDKIMMGTERRSMVMSEEEKLNTAYHESGHAIVGYLMPEHDPVYKVTIIPRGRALGVTMYLPEEDRYSTSKRRLESHISTLFGGRIAEEMINGPAGVTTGASNDIERATEIARNMVTKWGLSDRLGPQTYSEDDGEVFLGRSVTQHKQVSDDTAHTIDEEIRKIIDTNYARADRILKENIDKLHAMAKALMKYETIDDAQVKNIMEGRESGAPKDWDDDVVEPDSSDGGSAPAESDEAAGTIGGPAQET